MLEETDRVEAKSPIFDLKELTPPNSLAGLADGVAPRGKGKGRGKERERKEREGRRGSKEERNEGGEGDAPNLRTVPTPLITATSLCLLQFPGAVVICPQISLVGNRRFINQISREATRTLIPSLTGTQAQG